MRKMLRKYYYDSSEMADEAGKITLFKVCDFKCDSKVWKKLDLCTENCTWNCTWNEKKNFLFAVVLKLSVQEEIIKSLLFWSHVMLFKRGSQVRFLAAKNSNQVSGFHCCHWYLAVSSPGHCFFHQFLCLQFVKFYFIWFGAGVAKCGCNHQCIK